jgi:peptidyl-prolyl cis-trans isomerase D
LQRRAATELAAKAGAEKLSLLAAGKDAGVTFAAAQKLLRQQPAPNINQALLKSVFAADLSKGEATAGGANDAGGYTLVKVLKVVAPEALAAEKAKSLAQRLSGQSAGDLSNAYLGALKERVKVDIKKGAIPDKATESKQG